ncbi:phage holin [Virgibacillus salarius]|uniref:phage holin n=1 Tax=Virgibacillus salarius TaxID=447199 RepID=UPI002490B14A|nr:phage holin [Virgibacillus salarius]WBX81091.1 phage holin [Virgibacillus salarius]
MDKGTIIRTLVLALALLNQFLIIANLNPILWNNGDVGRSNLYYIYCYSKYMGLV